LHYPTGHWDFPKGHVEKDETEDQTLQREVEEETGIKELQILPGFRDKTIYFYRANGNEREERINDDRGLNIFKKVIYYIAKTTVSEILISHEHTEFEWLAYKKALEKITFENSKNILRKVYIFLNK